MVVKVVARVWNWLSAKVVLAYFFVLPYLVGIASMLANFWTSVITIATDAFSGISTWTAATWSRLVSATSVYLERLSNFAGRLYERLAIWAEKTWEDVVARANAISTWSIEIWDSLSRLLERLSGKGKP